MNTKGTLSESHRIVLINDLQKQYLPESVPSNGQIDQALLTSDYLGEMLSKHPEFITEFKNLKQSVDACWCQKHLSRYIDDVDGGKKKLEQFLRIFRHRAMVRIIARMANGISSISDTLEEVSQLAVRSVQFATDKLYSRLCASYGIPRNIDGMPQQLLVIAMGKLGGMELNLSSDIDLIFVYAEDGTSDKKEESLSNRVFFTRLGQQLIRLLNDPSEDGFVFRIDMRLRPYGSSGALVASFSELERYYKEQAREWERFALTRARAITGDERSKKRLHTMIDSFVFRKYVDFSVIRNLRDIKNDIHKQALRQGREQDIKLGSGGIREIEFVAQAYQLIYGGKHHQLRTASTRQALAAVANDGYLDKKVIQQLDSCYMFLRHLENHIQAFMDEQTHKLPDQPELQQRLAMAMGYDSWQDLRQQTLECRQQVHAIFDDLILGEKDNVRRRLIAEQYWIDTGNALFAGQHIDNELFTGNRQELVRFVGKVDKTCKQTSELCLSLFPFLLQAASKSRQPQLALTRLCSLIEAVIRRPVYLNLLNENLAIINLLCHSMVLSEWIYQHLCQYPALLETFINHDRDMPRPTRANSYDGLRNVLSGITEGDDEQQTEAMRHFLRDVTFRVVLAQITGRLPLPKVSDWLTFAAEACVEQAFILSWNNLIARHGLPEDMDHNSDPDASGFAIVAYGKLGSVELNYTSDLDLVFIYSGKPGNMTNGTRAISLVQLYTRLAQRIIHILTTPTSAGNGYQLDTRLRPQGNKGLLVNSIQGLGDYLRTDAWTWEHQALVKSRAIAGDRSTIDQFEQLRRRELCRRRDQDKLKQDILNMRRRIDQLKQDRDIKYGAGGLVDIEFFVQYMVLAHAHEYPEIIEHSDNIRQLEALSKTGILSQNDRQTLTRAYIALRTASHYLALGIDDHGIDIAAQGREVELIKERWI